MTESIEVPWRAELVRLIDDAITITDTQRNDPARPEPNIEMLDRTRAVLTKLRAKTIACHLPPPDGQTTLGIARGVTDVIPDPDPRLVRAASAVERHYLTIPPGYPRCPVLPPLTLVRIYADGSTKPPIPDGQALITIQDKDVFAAGIWRRGDFGGHKESPVNEAALMTDVRARVQSCAPRMLDNTDSTSVICPPDITGRMVWPEDQVQ